jgi:hypothetical protein
LLSNLSWTKMILEQRMMYCAIKPCRLNFAKKSNFTKRNLWKGKNQLNLWYRKVIKFYLKLTNFCYLWIVLWKQQLIEKCSKHKVLHTHLSETFRRQLPVHDKASTQLLFSNIHIVYCYYYRGKDNLKVKN